MVTWVLLNLNLQGSFSLDSHSCKWKSVELLTLSSKQICWWMMYVETPVAGSVPPKTDNKIIHRLTILLPNPFSQNGELKVWRQEFYFQMSISPHNWDILMRSIKVKEVIHHKISQSMVYLLKAPMNWNWDLVQIYKPCIFCKGWRIHFLSSSQIQNQPKRFPKNQTSNWYCCKLYIANTDILV